MELPQQKGKQGQSPLSKRVK